MKIRFLDSNIAAASDAEIESLERALGSDIPSDYRRFLLHHNGAIPEPNIFSIGNDNECGVNQFIPLGDLLNNKQAIAGAVCIEWLPIAWAECGNYVCLDLKGSDVFFWDHEAQENHIRLAENFAEFLEMLEPFGVSSVELDPAQVKSVWLDPNLFQKNDQE